MSTVSQVEAKRILVADDDESTVRHISKMLCTRFTVDTATSGSSVLQLCDQQPYYAVLLDVDFGPGISGLETASLLRAENEEVKIIVFSEHYSDSIKREVLALGAKFLPKPLALADLLEELGRT